MSYSILVTVNNSHYNNQKFFMYKNDDGESLTVFNLKEAETVEAILQTYPNVFSEIKIVPRSEEEIRLLETFWGENGRDLDFDFNFARSDHSKQFARQGQQILPLGRVMPQNRPREVQRTFLREQQRLDRRHRAGCIAKAHQQAAHAQTV